MSAFLRSQPSPCVMSRVTPSSSSHQHVDGVLQNRLANGNTERPPSTSMRPLIMAPREKRSSTESDVALAFHVRHCLRMTASRDSTKCLEQEMALAQNGHFEPRCRCDRLETLFIVRSPVLSWNHGRGYPARICRQAGIQEGTHIVVGFVASRIAVSKLWLSVCRCSTAQVATQSSLGSLTEPDLLCRV